MTLGPDLGWLADDEGNLRPQVARDLQQAPPPTPPRPPAPPPPAPRSRAAVPPQPPIPAAPPARLPVAHPLVPRVRAPRPTPVAPEPWRPVGQPPGPVVRARPSVPTVPILLGVIAGLIGLEIGAWLVPHPNVSVERPTMPPAAAAAGRPAFVNGANVNLRAGPGLSFPVILKLTAGESLMVREEQDGWFAVTTNTGTSGWVFGAFLRGQGNAEQGAAIVTQLLTSSGGAPRVVLRPGDKVFIVSSSDGQTDVILPTGRRLRVAPETLARVE